jgi:hypothetical protein
MATFYLLPSRSTVARSFVRLLDTVFPGMRWGHANCHDLAETVAALGEGQPDVYVVYRDDIPLDCILPNLLREWYGAEAGDLVVEVPEALDQSEERAKFWRISAERRAS